MSLPTLPTNRRFLTHLFNSLASASSPDPLNNVHPSNLDSLPDAAKKLLLALQVLFPSEFVPALDVLDRQLVTRFRIQDEDAHHQDDVEAEAAAAEEEETNINDDVELNDHAPEATTPGTTSGTTAQDLSIIDEEATATRTTDASAPPTQPSISSDHTTTPTVYYVRSAQHHRSSRYTTTTTTSYDPTPNYQVHLSTWSCSCPAFTFSAFPPHPPPSPPADPSQTTSPPPPPPPLQKDLHDDVCDAGTVWSFGGCTLDDENMPPVCKHLLACLLADKCKGLFGAMVQERVVSWAEAAGWAAGWGD